LAHHPLYAERFPAETGSDDLHKALGNPPANAGSSHQVANHREPQPCLAVPFRRRDW